jgi:hypothetical protein
MKTLRRIAWETVREELDRARDDLRDYRGLYGLPTPRDYEAPKCVLAIEKQLLAKVDEITVKLSRTLP